MLDEPTNALDEEGIEQIRKIIKEERERGAIVLIASHNKEDIEVLADKVFSISNGMLKESEEYKGEGKICNDNYKIYKVLINMSYHTIPIYRTVF